MDHLRRDILAAAAVIGPLAVLAGGCAGRPLLDNPIFVEANVPAGPCPNPVFLAAGPPEYAAVFEAVLTSLDDYFEIAYANRYDGTVRTHPKIAPGLISRGGPARPTGPSECWRPSRRSATGAT